MSDCQDVDRCDSSPIAGCVRWTNQSTSNSTYLEAWFPVRKEAVRTVASDVSWTGPVPSPACLSHEPAQHDTAVQHPAEYHPEIRPLAAVHNRNRQAARRTCICEAGLGEWIGRLAELPFISIAATSELSGRGELERRRLASRLVDLPGQMGHDWGFWGCAPRRGGLRRRAYRMSKMCTFAPSWLRRRSSYRWRVRLSAGKGRVPNGPAISVALRDVR
jgi:hypothetical protein